MRNAALLTLLLLTQATRAQVPDTAPLNALFAGSVHFEVDRTHQLIMRFHEAGVCFREDIAHLALLDSAAITYSVEEDGIALKCRTEHAKCLTKEIFKLDVIRVTSRVTVPRPAHDREGRQTIAALRDLLGQAHGDLAGTIRETKPVQERMNAR